MPTIDFSAVAKVTEPSPGNATVIALVLKKQALPGSPVDGQLAYDTADTKLKIYITNAWVVVGSQAT